MKPDALERCQKVIGHSFSDPKLLELALTHASVAASRLVSNERLEFLGDAVLGLVVCEDLYRRHARFEEGEMTKIKSAVVSRQTCAEIAVESGISELIRLGKGMPHSRGLPESVAAAVFEAVIGAIYLDGGLEPALQFVLRHVREHIQQSLTEESQRNYKSILQQHAQRTSGATPAYLVLDEKGPEHSKCFEVAVAINGKHFPGAWGRTKKEAEQAAALRTLRDLGLLKEGASDEEADAEASEE